MRRILPLVACVFLLGSCIAPEQHAVAAQRAEFAAITVPWLGYVEADPALSEADKAVMRTTAKTQDLRIRNLEEGVSK